MPRIANINIAKGAKQPVPERADGRKKEGLERRQRICELLLARGHVDVNELSEQLGTTPATVRRDLEKLEADGAARRVHGGAYPGSANGGVEVEFGLRLNFHAAAKRRIAAHAAALIKDGETVYLDAGTTAFMVAQELVGRSGLAVVTNSLAAAEVLRTARGITLFVVGGRYLPHTRSLIGPTAEEAIRSFRFRKMVLGTAGIDYENRALTQSAMEEVPIKRAAMSRSEQVILVADQSKFGRPALISMIPLAGVHKVITDSKPPEAAAMILGDLNIELVTVAPPGDLRRQEDQA